MTKRGFPEVLKKLRKDNKHTQEELASLLNVRKTTISNYETGYSMPDSKMLIEISKIYKVSVSNLLGQTFTGAKQPEYNKDCPVYKNEAVNKVLVINELDSIENKNDREILYCITIPMLNNSDGMYIGVRIRGNYLNKSNLNDKDIAIIKLSSDIKNDEIAVVCINEKDYHMLKYYNYDNNYIMLSPDSYDKNYNPIIINPSIDNIRIIGKVVNAIISL